MRIIPAIDIIAGKCVRLSQGNYQTQKVYREDPLELALELQDHGIQYLHLVDLDGAKEKSSKNLAVLNRIALKTKLKVDFGGGIKQKIDIFKAFENGANQVTLGSMAVKNQSLFLECLQEFGSSKIILGADSRNRKIATDGWLKHSKLDVVEFIEGYVDAGVEYVICTDISRDGMLQGAANGLYEEILDKCAVKLFASGGVSCKSDLLALRNLGCEGAIVGKALYEGFITLKELSELC
jgi:phosphoribosylformimino-5-aminoimidazole carboxamide ribotide isomerase